MKIISIKDCNQYCTSRPRHINTYILPPYWQCKYHRFLTSLSARSPSWRRPRLIKEFHKSDGDLVIAVYIGGYDQPLDQLLANPDPYLSYVVMNSDGMYVYDPRFRNMYKISLCSGDENIVWERVRYDFFAAQRNGEHVIIKRGQQASAVPALHVLSFLRDDSI
jgi:hypothetical protein